MMGPGGGGGYASMVSAGGPGFSTQDGAGRQFSPGGYAAAQAAGGQRQTSTSTTQQTSAPAIRGTPAPKGNPATPVMTGPMSATRPGGYVPTYLKYGAITPKVQGAVSTPMSVGAGLPNVPVSVTMPSTGSGPGSSGGGMASAPNTGVRALGGATSGPMNYWTQATGLTGNPNSANSAHLAAQGLKPIEIPQAGPLFGGYYDAINNAMQSGIQGYSDIVGQQLKQQIGQTLGGINAIGGLRSGAVPAYINQAMTNFGNQVGDYASMAQQNVLQDSLTANQDNINNLINSRNYTAAKRATEGLAPVIGSLTGLAGQALLGMNNKGNNNQGGGGGSTPDPSSYLAMAGAFG